MTIVNNLRGKKSYNSSCEKTPRIGPLKKRFYRNLLLEILRNYYIRKHIHPTFQDPLKLLMNLPMFLAGLQKPPHRSGELQ